MLWADFSSPTMLDSPTTAFVASTYAIVSMEKCFGHAAGLDTEDAFQLYAAALKAVNPAVSVLFYWHMAVEIAGPSFDPCYAAGREFLARPDLWLYGDDGAPLLNGPFLQRNLTLADTQRYMVGNVLKALQRNTSNFDGVFADGALQNLYPNMSQSRMDAQNNAVNAVALSETLALQAVKPGVRLITNGLAQYHTLNPSFPVDDGMTLLGFSDGVCVEHWAAFEMTDGTNCSIKPQLMDAMLGHVAVAAARNKTVLIKGWPGPVNTPILSLGPSWPAACGDPGESREARAAAALDWFTPSYALFLLAVEPTVFWSYSWWYSAVDGYFPPPAPGDANTTSAPYGWYPELSKPLGPPNGPAHRIPGGSGWMYTRSFARAVVTVDLADYKRTASIVWG